jgi:hypothetical protein
VTARPAVVAGTIVAVLAAFVWVVQLATLSDLPGSDAAGNGIAQAFAALDIILLWGLLAVLVILTGVAGVLPLPAVLPGLLLLPLSGVAAMRALYLLSHPNSPPFLWPIIVSTAVPPLIVLFCVWAAVPLTRRAVPAWCAAGLVWGGIVLLSASVWPMERVREAVVAQEQTKREEWAADFAKLPRDAPLWEWTPFLATPDNERLSAVIQGIRQLERRQADAEAMLDRGDFPLRFMGQLDLTPTSSICDKARALLRRWVVPLVLKPGETKPYGVIRGDVADAVAAMQWLVGYNCSCDAEALAWETMANAYSNTEFDVFELRRVRDSKVLGQTLREAPERFSMLSPRSHLKAWLHFAEDKSLRDQALAGARTLDHRTEDAIENLGGSEYDAWHLLIWLPELDLRATPELCAAALGEVYRELTRIYRPRSDDPRPYGELLERMGTGKPLEALVWLAGHGCDTNAGVSEAEALVSAYQDSPDRTAMLATLSGLHRKP